MYAKPLHRLRHAQDPAGHGAPPPVIDPAALDRLRQLDPDGQRGFLVQVLRTYENSLLRYLTTLAGARTQGDLKLAGDTAHTLKSSSAAIGALGFSSRCAELERMARAGEAGALGAPLDGLLAEADRVLHAVRAMLPT
jgi:HPt (histidine-containing phosphotransfer) domain-containing protein